MDPNPPLPGWQPPHAPPSGFPGPVGSTGDGRRRFGTGAIVGSIFGGMALGAILTLLGLAVIVAVVGTDPPAKVFSTYRAPAQGTDGPRAGTCLSDRPVVVDVWDRRQVTSCATLHGTEVIGTAMIPDLAAVPTPGLFREFVNGACGLHLRDYVGSKPDDTELSFGAITPDPAAWKAGERRAICVVASSGHRGGLGSVKGTGA